MKNRILILLMAIGMIACGQKEMKVARNHQTVVSELDDQSPIYINRVDGKVVMNDHNRIGNTDWVLSVDRSLSVKEILPFLEQLMRKKYDPDGMHADHRMMYFVYSDTLHQKNAYVPFAYKKIQMLAENADSSVFYKIPASVSNQKDRLGNKTKAYSTQLTVEEFVGLLIENQTSNLSSEKSDVLYLYE